jgi:hypothetical protein
MIAPGEKYRDWLSGAEHLRERTPVVISAGSELEWQARWFGGEFGWEFTAVSGERIEVVQPGVWNHEAGPDFAEAAIRVNGGPAQRGCVELDLEVRDWERHGHARNPAYEAVLVHLFFQRGAEEFFTRTPGHRNVLQIQLDATAVLERAPTELLPARPGRCVAPLAQLPSEKVREILEAAALHRLQRKAARFARLEQAHGADEALYQMLAETLGYKSNKLAFLLLAQRLSLRLLRAADDPAALLFGVSGFLPVELSALERETREYLRTTWDGWWQRRVEMQRLELPREVWKLSGHRPLNHPQRRVGALAALVKNWKRLRPLVDGADATVLEKFFGGLADEYWSHHYTLTSKGSLRPLALIGKERVRQMLANVFYPMRWLRDAQSWEAYAALPASSENRQSLTAALRLFGPQPDSRWLQREAWQQGLLQIYHDFCAKDASDCAACPFPSQLRHW